MDRKLLFSFLELFKQIDSWSFLFGQQMDARKIIMVGEQVGVGGGGWIEGKQNEHRISNLSIYRKNIVTN